MESSFCIWLNRNNRDWKSRDHSVPTAKISEPGNITRLPKSSEKTEPTFSSARNKLCKPVGFINKENTCYANSILQALSTVLILWSRLPSESSITSPISKATTLNMSIQKKALKPIDPSNFLWALKRKMSDIRNVPFDFNSQQDAVEVLQVVLDDLKGTSILANDLVSNTLNTTITCITCLCSAAKEEKCDMLPLPMSNNIITSLDKLLHSQTSSSQNKWFCSSCESLTETTKETSITNSLFVSIVQLIRFCILDNRAIKGKQIFDCFQAKS